MRRRLTIAAIVLGVLGAGYSVLGIFMTATFTMSGIGVAMYLVLFVVSLLVAGAGVVRLRRTARSTLSSGPESRRAEPKRVVGLAIRTTNAAESDPSSAKIPTLWERFGKERWAERLDEVGAFGPTTAVYSAYESDATGSYQLLVGRQVRDSSPVSAPLQVVSTSPGSYRIFQCSGPMPQAVIDGWRDVWTYFASANVPGRAFTSDFEIYPDSGPVEIWVAVRPQP